MSQRSWVLALAAVASFMVALDTLVVSTALTTIRADLGASVEELEWTVNAYNLSFAVLLLTASALGDRFGRRRLFAAGLALFALSSAACALAPDATALIVARAVQGVGAAFVMPLALTLVGAAFPPERRGSAMGALQGLTGLAVGGGPVIGGAIADGLAWQWIFWVNVPIGLLAVPFVLARIPESRGSDRALDLPGLVLITLAAFGIVWGLVRGNAAGWGSAETVGSIAAGVLALIAFVVHERRTRTPMLPPALFERRAFAAGNAAGFLMTAALFSAVFFFAQFLQAVLGHDPLGAGLRLLPWTATLFFVAPVAGALVDRHGERPFLVTGLDAAGRRLRLHRAGRPGVPADGARADGRRRGHLDGVARDDQRRRRRGRPGGHRQGVRRRSARCASSAACSGSRSRSRCSPARAATRRSPTASAARWWSPPRSRWPGH